MKFLLPATILALFAASISAQTSAPKSAKSAPAKLVLAPININPIHGYLNFSSAARGRVDQLHRLHLQPL
jgi:hypothetical protein